MSPTPTARLLASRSHVYDSLTELRQDSTDVVIAIVENDVKTEKVGPLPFSVTTVLVDEVVGEAKNLKPGSRVPVRQLGSPTVVAEDVELLVPGTKYLLYLQPFVLEDGESTGQYSTSGSQAGVYKADAISGTFSKTDSASPDLPAKVTKATAAAG